MASSNLGNAAITNHHSQQQQQPQFFVWNRGNQQPQQSVVLASSSPNNYQTSAVGLVGGGSGSMIAQQLEASYEANKHNFAISNAAAAGPLKQQTTTTPGGGGGGSATQRIYSQNERHLQANRLVIAPSGVGSGVGNLGNFKDLPLHAFGDGSHFISMSGKELGRGEASSSSPPQNLKKQTAPVGAKRTDQQQYWQHGAGGVGVVAGVGTKFSSSNNIVGGGGGNPSSSWSRNNHQNHQIMNTGNQSKELKQTSYQNQQSLRSGRMPQQAQLSVTGIQGMGYQTKQHFMSNYQKIQSEKTRTLLENQTRQMIQTEKDKALHLLGGTLQFSNNQGKVVANSNSSPVAGRPVTKDRHNPASAIQHSAMNQNVCGTDGRLNTAANQPQSLGDGIIISKMNVGGGGHGVKNDGAGYQTSRRNPMAQKKGFQAKFYQTLSGVNFSQYAMNSGNSQNQSQNMDLEGIIKSEKYAGKGAMRARNQQKNQANTQEAVQSIYGDGTLKYDVIRKLLEQETNSSGKVVVQQNQQRDDFRYEGAAKQSKQRKRSQQKKNRDNTGSPQRKSAEDNDPAAGIDGNTSSKEIPNQASLLLGESLLMENQSIDHQRLGTPQNPNQSKLGGLRKDRKHQLKGGGGGIEDEDSNCSKDSINRAVQSRQSRIAGAGGSQMPYQHLSSRQQQKMMQIMISANSRDPKHSLAQSRSKNLAGNGGASFGNKQQPRGTKIVGGGGLMVAGQQNSNHRTEGSEGGTRGDSITRWEDTLCVQIRQLPIYSKNGTHIPLYQFVQSSTEFYPGQHQKSGSNGPPPPPLRTQYGSVNPQRHQTKRDSEQQNAIQSNRYFSFLPNNSGFQDPRVPPGSNLLVTAQSIQMHNIPQSVTGSTPIKDPLNKHRKKHLSLMNRAAFEGQAPAQGILNEQHQSTKTLVATQRPQQDEKQSPEGKGGLISPSSQNRLIVMPHIEFQDDLHGATAALIMNRSSHNYFNASGGESDIMLRKGAGQPQELRRGSVKASLSSIIQILNTNSMISKKNSYFPLQQKSQPDGYSRTGEILDSQQSQSDKKIFNQTNSATKINGNPARQLQQLPNNNVLVINNQPQQDSKLAPERQVVARDEDGDGGKIGEKERKQAPNSSSQVDLIIKELNEIKNKQKDGEQMMGQGGVGILPSLQRTKYPVSFQQQMHQISASAKDIQLKAQAKRQRDMEIRLREQQAREIRETKHKALLNNFERLSKHMKERKGALVKPLQFSVNYPLGGDKMTAHEFTSLMTSSENNPFVAAHTEFSYLQQDSLQSGYPYLEGSLGSGSIGTVVNQTNGLNQTAHGMGTNLPIPPQDNRFFKALQKQMMQNSSANWSLYEAPSQNYHQEEETLLMQKTKNQMHQMQMSSSARIKSMITRKGACPFEIQKNVVFNQQAALSRILEVNEPEGGVLEQVPFLKQTCLVEYVKEQWSGLLNNPRVLKDYQYFCIYYSTRQTYKLIIFGQEFPVSICCQELIIFHFTLDVDKQAVLQVYCSAATCCNVPLYQQPVTNKSFIETILKSPNGKQIPMVLASGAFPRGIGLSSSNVAGTSAAYISGEFSTTTGRKGGRNRRGTKVLKLKNSAGGVGNSYNYLRGLGTHGFGGSSDHIDDEEEMTGDEYNFDSRQYLDPGQLQAPFDIQTGSSPRLLLLNLKDLKGPQYMNMVQQSYAPIDDGVRTLSQIQESRLYEDTAGNSTGRGGTGEQINDISINKYLSRAESDMQAADEISPNI